ncbi:MAG: hypothetical protein A4E19_04360 [Nitrospira sp. SG-bin1]|nr:MAG: hypothetical protein A4E19_04360 [Nitrospira sp. SG-bin1]
MTPLHVSALAALCLLLAGLCRWTSGAVGEHIITERPQGEPTLLEAHTVVELAMEGISKLDERGHYVFVNTQYAAVLGYRPEELIGQSWEITVHPDDRTCVLNAFAQMLALGRAEAEIRGIRKDGSLIHKHVVIVKPDTMQEKMSGHYCFMRDITERKWQEAFLSAEKQALELVAQEADLSEVLAFICRTIESHTAPMLCSVMLVMEDGGHLASAAGPSLPDEYNRAVHGIPIGPTVGSCGSAAHFGKPSIVADISFNPLWKDYASVALTHGLKACWSHPILSSTGTVLGTFAAYYREPRFPNSTDLKIVERASHIAALAIEHVRMNEALRESEARFQAFMRHSPAVTFIKDEAGRHLYVNPVFEKRFNVSLDGVRGKTNDDLMPPAVAAKLNEHDRRVLSSEEVLEVEETVPTPDGHSEQWLVLKFPLNGSQGERLLGGIAIDITARKRLEAQLAQQKEHLRLFIEHSPVALAVLDREMRYLAVSRRWRSDYHLGDEPLIGRSHYEIFPEISDRWRAVHRRCLAGAVESRQEDPFVRLDGRTDWSRWEIRPWLTPEGTIGGIVIFSEDITARKQAEEFARESEERFRVIADTAPVLIWMSGLDKRCTYFNRGWLDYTGRTMEQELGDGWVAGVHPDDVDRCRSVYAEAFDRREPFTMEYRLRKAGGDYGWIHDSGVPRRLADGTFAGYLGACIDVTARKIAEEHLQRTRFAMDQAVDAVYWIDPQARILYTNGAASAMLGYTADEFLRLTVHDLNPDFPPDVWPEWWAQMRERKVMSLESVHLTKDGRRIPIDIRVSVLAYGSQEFHCAFVRDITERKRGDQALRESQERFELAARATNDGIWDWNILTGQQYWSDRNFELFGLEPTALAPTYETWISLLHPDDADRAHRAVCHHLETREPYDIEVRVRMKNGSYRWFRDQGQAVWDDTGRPVRMVGSISDVTERRIADDVLRSAHADLEQRVKERTRQLEEANLSLQDEIMERKRAEKALQLTQFTVDRAAQGIFWVGPNAEILYVNEAASQVLGYSREELLHMTVHDIDPNFPPEAWPAHWAELKRRGSFTFESSQHTKRGGVRYTEITVNHLEYDGQEYNCAIVRDVTERKTIEARLRTTQYAVDHASDQIFLIAPDGRFLDVNEAACRRLGYAKEELLTKSVMDIDPNYPRAVWDRHWETFVQAGQLRLETTHRGKSGELYPVEVTANYLVHNGQEIDCAIIRDITERKQAEEALRDSELRYKLLTEATFDGIAIHDQGILLEVNAGLERMFGYEPGELIGRSMWDLIAEESRDLVLANMRHGVNGPYEAMGRRKDGTTFPGEVVARSCSYRGKQVRLVAGRDITERKHLETEQLRHTEELERQVAERTDEIAKLESRRTQTEKLAAMGRLAAGVAHEINNPIAGIKNAFTLVKQALDPAHPHAEFAGMIDREVARVASIVQNMYQLYRPESGKGEAVEVEIMVRDIDALFMKRLQQRRLRLFIEVDSGVSRLCVPRGDLLQVLLNLLNNAIDCSNEGGTITLAFRVEPETIRITVSDRGSGIAPENLPHIFDPFFTTKTGNDQKGMGLGLSISQSLVMAMGGKIEVETELNGGSTFSVLLPRHTAAARAQDPSDTTKEVMTYDR